MNESNTIFQADESRIGWLHVPEALFDNSLAKIHRAAHQGQDQSAEDLTTVFFKNTDRQIKDKIIASWVTTRTFTVEYAYKILLTDF